MTLATAVLAAGLVLVLAAVTVGDGVLRGLLTVVGLAALAGSTALRPRPRRR